MREIFREEPIKKVVEFGAGLSSMLMSERVEVVSYETDPKTLDGIMGKRTPDNNLTVRLWDGKAEIDIEPCDMVFIDGPPGGVGEGRKYSYMSAAKAKPKFILTHDSGRTGEIELAKKYLWDEYEVVGTNGTHQQHCELWIRKDSIKK
jgi:hypothetical protein